MLFLCGKLCVAIYYCCSFVQCSLAFNYSVEVVHVHALGCPPSRTTWRSMFIYGHFFENARMRAQIAPATCCACVLWLDVAVQCSTVIPDCEHRFHAKCHLNELYCYSL